MIRRSRLAAAVILLAAAAVPATAGSLGDAAIERGEPASAIEFWKVEARDGSIHAKLQLGLAYDLGRGAPADRVQAMLWYIQAAEAGHPVAQFNVGVMLDSGVALAGRSVKSGSIWYARAAANGHDRAQYNMGLLYEAGEGVAQNNDLARYWFALAARTLPAAEEKLEALPPGTWNGTLGAPEPMDAALVELDGLQFGEFVWTAPPGPRGGTFTVEIVAAGPGETGWSAPILTRSTEASALVAELGNRGAAFAWRVLRDNPAIGEQASSGWHRLGPSQRPLPADTAITAPPGRDTVLQQAAEEVPETMTR